MTTFLSPPIVVTPCTSHCSTCHEEWFDVFLHDLFMTGESWDVPCHLLVSWLPQSLQWPGRAFGFPFLARIEMCAFPTLCRPVLVPISGYWRLSMGTKRAEREAYRSPVSHTRCDAGQCSRCSVTCTSVPLNKSHRAPGVAAAWRMYLHIGVFTPQRCGNSLTDKCMPWYYSELQVPHVSLIVIGWFRNWKQPVSCNIWGYGWYDPCHWLPSYALVSRCLCCWPVGCT